MKRTLLLIAVLSLLLFTGWKMQKTQYEYRVISSSKGSAPKDINTLGQEGWELVAVQSFVFHGNSAGAEYIFKRAK